MITQTEYDSPLGTLTLAASEEGLVAILWPRDERWEYEGAVEGDTGVLRQARLELDEYFAGSRNDFDVPLDLRGTDFQQLVWQSLAEIPFGETVSYAKQAANMGRPSSIRAIASANGKNPVSIILPCHRVIGSDGSLTGYAGGLDKKRWLLAHEGVMLDV